MKRLLIAVLAMTTLSATAKPVETYTVNPEMIVAMACNGYSEDLKVYASCIRAMTDLVGFAFISGQIDEMCTVNKGKDCPTQYAQQREVFKEWAGLK